MLHLNVYKYTVLSTVLLFVGLGFALPVRAAITHNYVCSDFDTITGAASCSSNVLTFTSGGTQVAYDDFGVGYHFDLGQGPATWYISFDVAGSPGGTGKFDCISESTGTCNLESFTTTVVDHPITVTNSGSMGLILRNNSASFHGTLSNICISDTVDTCRPPSGGSTPSSDSTGVVAAQLDSSNRVQVWQTGSGSGAANLNTDFIQLGTPLNADTSISGFTFFMESDGDNTDTSVSTQLDYADTGDTICAASSHLAISAFGDTTVDVRGVMGQVYITCNTNPVIDHNRPLKIEVWAGSDAHQSKVYTLGSASQMYYQLSTNSQYVGGTVFGQTSYDSIITTRPLGGSVVATSTHFIVGGSGNMSSKNFVPNHTNLDVCINSVSGKLGSNVFQPTASEYCQYEVLIPITATSSFSVVATTSLTTTGIFIAHTSITVPLISLLGFGVGTKTLVSTTTAFTVSTSTSDQRRQLAQLGLTQAIDTGTLTGNELSVCNISITGFDVFQCFVSFFVPSPDDIRRIQGTTNTILEKVPWGYVTRSVALLGGTASSTNDSGVSANLPSLVIPVGELPVASGSASLNLTPWNELMGSTSLLGTATSTYTGGQTFRQMIEPGWDFLVIFLTGLAMLARLLGINLTGGVETQLGNVRRAEKAQSKLMN